MPPQRIYLPIQPEVPPSKIAKMRKEGLSEELLGLAIRQTNENNFIENMPESRGEFFLGICAMVASYFNWQKLMKIVCDEWRLAKSDKIDFSSSLLRQVFEITSNTMPILVMNPRDMISVAIYSSLILEHLDAFEMQAKSLPFLLVGPNGMFSIETADKSLEGEAQKRALSILFDNTPWDGEGEMLFYRIRRLIELERFTLIEQLLQEEKLKENLFKQDVDLCVLAADCLKKGNVNLAKVLMKGIVTVKKAGIHRLLYPALELDNIQLLLKIMEHFGPNEVATMKFIFLDFTRYL